MLPIYIEVGVKSMTMTQFVTPFKMSLNVGEILAVFCHESPEGFQASILTMHLGAILTTQSYDEVIGRIEIAKNDWIESLKQAQV